MKQTTQTKTPAKATQSTAKAQTPAIKATAKAMPANATKSVYSAIGGIVGFIDAAIANHAKDKGKPSFYPNALKTHLTNGKPNKSFPRPAYAERAKALANAKEKSTEDQAIRAIFKLHDSRTLNNAMTDSRAIFDVYMASKYFGGKGLK